MSKLIYCYDAYCGWCYGFSKVMQQVDEKYGQQMAIEVLSGGMILPDEPIEVEVFSSTVLENYKRVEEYTGIEFGEDFLWHYLNPDKSDWFPNSLMPAIALCIVKEKKPEMGLQFAIDISYGLNYEGRDLTDPEAYRHLLDKYGFEAEEFYEKLKSEMYKSMAEYEFAIMKQLRIDSYPVLLLQESESKFHMIAKGYTDYETVNARILATLASINT